MTPDHRAVELVIETAAGVLTGRFWPREAVTILASQVPQALAGAGTLVSREPARAAAYAELLKSVRDELAARLDGAHQVRDLRAVVSEVERVVRALGP